MLDEDGAHDEEMSFRGIVARCSSFAKLDYPSLDVDARPRARARSFVPGGGVEAGVFSGSAYESPRRRVPEVENIKDKDARSEEETQTTGTSPAYDRREMRARRIAVSAS